jgi:hypothetical protein
MLLKQSTLRADVAPLRAYAAYMMQIAVDQASLLIFEANKSKDDEIQRDYLYLFLTGPEEHINSMS